ncbi:13850_t:CDS:10 [Funneliformis caledonium]|uniref:uridine/cytidine kinase n=1 Tax=Funneliformis caledonium TaxID=1117310 RepID=A0A9N8VTZ9_9GLOM|nr:13850_t:CDS:10 [Funneliformis caledonium]
MNKIGWVEIRLLSYRSGSASGKTSVSVRIIENLNVPWVGLLSMDSFYKVLNPVDKIEAHNNNFNFDHPNAFDFDLLFDTLKNMKGGKKVEIPIYDFVTHARLPQTSSLYGANIFVDTDSDIRLIRRLKRDINERGRDFNGVIQQYQKFVKPSFDQYIQPTVKNADVIIPRGLDNLVAIDLITKHIQRQLNERQFNFRWDLLKFDCDYKEIPKKVTVLEQTTQLKGIHTIIRDRNTKRDDFIFYAERLAATIVERALSELLFTKHEIITPLHMPYVGKRYTMQLHFINLPNNVHECYVLLMDAQIATGAAALMAIRVLLDHNVPEDRIMFLTFLATPLGLHVISNAFPKVKICTSMIDPKINDETLFIEPGMGNFGDRYYGTDI